MSKNFFKGKAKSKEIKQEKTPEELAMDSYDGSEVIDDEGRSSYDWNKQGQQIKDIVIDQIRKLSLLSVQELREGYWKKKPVKVGDGIVMTETYFPDTREAFINGVDFLFTLIEPTLKEDERNILKDFHEKQEKELDKIFEKYKKENLDADDYIDEKLVFKKKLFSQINLHLDYIDYFTAEDDAF